MRVQRLGCRRGVVASGTRHARYNWGHPKPFGGPNCAAEQTRVERPPFRGGANYEGVEDGCRSYKAALLGDCHEGEHRLAPLPRWAAINGEHHAALQGSPDAPGYAVTVYVRCDVGRTVLGSDTGAGLGAGRRAAARVPGGPHSSAVKGWVRKVVSDRPASRAGVTGQVSARAPDAGQRYAARCPRAPGGCRPDDIVMSLSGACSVGTVSAGCVKRACLGRSG